LQRPRPLSVGRSAARESPRSGAMRCVIRRNGLYLALHGLSYIRGTWTPHWQLARVFRSRREADAYLAGSDLVVEECEVVPAPGGRGHRADPAASDQAN